MEFSKDELRRDVAASRGEQRRAMHDLRGGLRRLLEDDGALSAAEKADVLVGGWGRRRFLAIGGFSVATAAVLAACGSDAAPGNVPESGIPPTTTALPEQVLSDSTLLRTASSLEHSAIAAYQAALDTGALSAPVADAARLFQDQHREHAVFFEKLTKENGAEPFTDPNPVVQKNILDPALKLIVAGGTKEVDLVFFARVLEEVAAGTYQSFVPLFSLPKWRGDVMSVGGVEARHAAALAKLLPFGQVTPLAEQPAAEATTTVPPDADTSAPALVLAPVYQVPGAFNPQSGVPLIIGVDELTVELLGPNSYMYE